MNSTTAILCELTYCPCVRDCSTRWTTGGTTGELDTRLARVLRRPKSSASSSLNLTGGDAPSSATTLSGGREGGQLDLTRPDHERDPLTRRPWPGSGARADNVQLSIQTSSRRVGSIAASLVRAKLEWRAGSGLGSADDNTCCNGPISTRRTSSRSPRSFGGQAHSQTQIGGASERTASCLSEQLDRARELRWRRSASRQDGGALRRPRLLPRFRRPAWTLGDASCS